MSGRVQSAIDRPTKRQWTVDDFRQMAEAGVLSARAELVHGEIIDMPPQGNAHAIVVTNLARLLLAQLMPPWFVRLQATHRFTNDLAYEPDLCVLEREPIPGAVLDDLPKLIIEVSESTLDHDLSQKRLDYGRLGVEEYWVVDLKRGQVRVFRDSDPSASDAEGAYRHVDLLSEDQELSPLLKPSLKIRVRDVLPTVP